MSCHTDTPSDVSIGQSLGPAAAPAHVALNSSTRQRAWNLGAHCLSLWWFTHPAATYIKPSAVTIILIFPVHYWQMVRVSEEVPSLHIRPNLIPALVLNVNR